MDDRKHVVADDDLFFEQHPDRKYRIRRASPVEVRQHGALPALPQGQEFLAIWSPEPGRRIGLLTSNREDVATDLDEKLAHCIFDILADIVEGNHGTAH